jgi:hypothetical protein
MAEHAGGLICSLSRCLVPKLEACPLRGLKITAYCTKCGAERTASKGIFIATEELTPVFKLIGEPVLSHSLRLGLGVILQCFDTIGGSIPDPSDFRRFRILGSAVYPDCGWDPVPNPDPARLSATVNKHC